MNILRSPGGCPWDAEQTHISLAKSLLDEAHETVESIESGDQANLADELGDVLLQVLFHARIAAEVRRGFRYRRRRRQVGRQTATATSARLRRRWKISRVSRETQITATEKPNRATNDLLAGILVELLTFLIVEKVLARVGDRGVDVFSTDNIAVGAQRLALVTASRESPPTRCCGHTCARLRHHATEARSSYRRRGGKRVPGIVGSFGISMSR